MNLLHNRFKIKKQETENRVNIAIKYLLDGQEKVVHIPHQKNNTYLNMVGIVEAWVNSKGMYMEDIVDISVNDQSEII